jgi:hypothetical protein
VVLRRPRRIEVAGVPRPLNVDGEAWGRLPATVEACPGALRWIGS